MPKFSLPTNGNYIFDSQYITDQGQTMSDNQDVKEFINYWMQTVIDEMRHQAETQNNVQQDRFDTLMGNFERTVHELLTLKEKVDRLEDELLIAIEGKNEAV